VVASGARMGDGEVTGPATLAKLTPSHLRKVARARKRGARQRIEDRLGLYIRRWPLDGTAPAELGRLLRALEITCVVDVGAHTGGFGRIVRRLGFDADIISFEPATATFRELARRTRHDPRWSVHRMALGATAARMELDIYEETQLNSLRRPRSLLDSPVAARPQGSETVEVVRLDDVVAQLVPASVRVLLKIDAQGFDLEVLRGAQGSLAVCSALQVEVSGSALYEGSPPLEEVVAYLAARSFHLTGLFPVYRRPPSHLEVVDFDATFVRLPLAVPTAAPP
jgi:FkbM family methyltransferase